MRYSQTGNGLGQSSFLFRCIHSTQLVPTELENDQRNVHITAIYAHNAALKRPSHGNSKCGNAVARQGPFSSWPKPSRLALTDWPKPPKPDDNRSHLSLKSTQWAHGSAKGDCRRRFTTVSVASVAPFVLRAAH